LTQVCLECLSFDNGTKAALLRTVGQDLTNVVGVLELSFTGRANVANKMQIWLKIKLRGLEEISYDKTMFYAGEVTGDVAIIVGEISLAVSTAGASVEIKSAVNVGGVLAEVVETVAVGKVIEAGILVHTATKTPNVANDFKDLVQSIKGGNNSNHLKKVKSNTRANEIAQEFDYEGAEDLKETFVGKGNVSKFNMMIDSETKEVILESISDSSIHVPTGLYYK